MELTDKQIEHLFEFTKSKNVHYDDVCYEIVDHLATGIEEKLASNSYLTFEGALRMIYSNFPVTGFAALVEEKEKALLKYWRGKIIGVVLSYFRLPKIILTLAIFAFFYKVHIMFPALNLMVIGLLLSLYLNIICFSNSYNSMRLKSERYLFSVHFYRCLSFILSLPMLYFYFGYNRTYPGPYVDQSPWFDHSSWWNLIPCTFSCLIIAINIIMAIALVRNEFHDLLIEEVEQKYQHLNISLS